MPPAATREPFARWSENSRRTALAIIAEREICDVNARFSELDSAHGSWSWLDGPHAKVRYEDLPQLVRCEAATLAPAPYLSRFERSGQVVEVRLERLDGSEAIAIVHDVTSELHRQRDLQREREALMHEERMHAMGVLASGVAHDLNHALNVIALRVATLRADSQMARSRRTLDVLARVVGDAARIVARLQDLARKRRDRPHDALDLAAVLTGAIEMARTETDTANVRIEADVPPLPLVRGSAAELAHVFGSLLLHAREQMPEGGRGRAPHAADPHRRRRTGQPRGAARSAGDGEPARRVGAQRPGRHRPVRARRALRSGPLRRGDAADERMAGGAGDPADRAGHAGVDADRLGQRDRRGRSAAAVRAWGAGETARPGPAPFALDDIAGG